MSKREKILVYALGILFPIYPSYVIIRLEHIDPNIIQYFKIVLISIINAFIVGFLLNRGLFLKAKVKGVNNFDIHDYLDSKYTIEEQKKMLLNFREFTSKYLRKVATPVFTNKALKNDKILKEYMNQILIIFLKIFGGGILYILVLMSFYFFIIYV